MKIQKQNNSADKYIINVWGYTEILLKLLNRRIATKWMFYEGLNGGVANTVHG